MSKLTEFFFSSRKRKVLAALAAFLMIAIGLFFAMPTMVARSRNSVHSQTPYVVSQNADDVHKTLLIADLHADSLLWDRDLLVRGKYGHVDLPRLVEGNVALQAFTIVTKVPMITGFQGHAVPPDVTIKALVMAQGWPRETWTSLHARALYQTKRLHDLEARSQGQFRVIKTREGLARYLKDRKQFPKITAGFLGIEGAHCLEGKIENLEELFAAGVRMIGPTHFFDTKLGGSAHGKSGEGLTDFGRQVITRMEVLGIAVDLSHASPKMIDDIIAIAKKPLIVSHTGVKGTHESPRNLSDKHLQEIAKGGGLIGIAFFKSATGGLEVSSIVKAIKYTRDLVGVDAVALGSDFDGSVSTPFDSSQFNQLTSALIDAGFSESDLHKIMGENVMRLLRKTLPSSKVKRQ
jgi:membrane dipeptidase